MINLGRLTSLALVLTVVGLGSVAAHSEEFCENWANYMWDFENISHANKDVSSTDTTWTELNAMNTILHKGRRIAAVGSVSEVEAYPFPAVPSLVENGLDDQIDSKVHGLYDRYVLLGRKIEDMWKDRFRNTNSPTSMQRFVAERDKVVSEMNKVAEAAKGELIHYGTRSKDCFPAYEKVAKQTEINLNQSLANATSALKSNESMYAHTSDADAPAVEVVNPSAVLGHRVPASDSVPVVAPVSDSSATE